MLKPLTLSLSLAVALGYCSVSMAGLHDSQCSTCGLASPQGVVASPQGPIGGCAAPCAPRSCHFTINIPRLSCHLPKLQHTCSYEWVLKKKHNWCLVPNQGCGTCGGGGAVYATGQAAPAPSGQYAAPQVYGAGQHAFQAVKPPATIASIPAEMTPALPGGEEVPPAPEVKGTSVLGAQSGLLLPTPSGN
jgi:hypothetical protein